MTDEIIHPLPPEELGLYEFLQILFKRAKPDEEIFFNVTDTVSPNSTDPKKFWAGRHEPLHEISRAGKWHAGNTYYCPSSVMKVGENDVVRRDRKHFCAMYLAVLDDVRDLSTVADLDPTYVLETSEGNYQVGFRFTEPIRDLAVARAFTKGLALKGHCANDPSGNNPVRWVRAPGGKNWKYTPAFTHKLIVWSPEVLFEPHNLAEFLGFDLDSMMEPEPKPVLTTIEADKIISGHRNDQLTRMAGKMRRHGFSFEEINAALDVANSMRCDPPLDPFEIEGIAQSVARYAPSEVPDLRFGATKPVTTSDLVVPTITMEELESAKISPRVIINNFLYADVRGRYAAGGTGKTTLALYEMVTAALGRRVWGYEVSKPVNSIMVTREDSREIMLARLYRIMKQMGLSPAEMNDVLQRVRILDLVGSDFRLSFIGGDVVRADRDAIQALVDALGPLTPDWVIFDPLVSFGVGEGRVNDAEQGLIEASRIIVRALDCCVELIHHTGKAAALDDTRDDQYSGRGGSALSDGCRMVVTMRHKDPAAFLKETGHQLKGTSGIKMSLPKLSYCAPQDPIYIDRSTSYHFRMVEAEPETPQERNDRAEEQLLSWMKSEIFAGKVVTYRRIKSEFEDIGLGRNQALAAIERLESEGKVVAPEHGKKGGYTVPATVPGGPSRDVPDEAF